MSLHHYQPPTSVRALRAEAAKAKNSSQLAAIVRELVTLHGPSIALKTLGSRHELATGRKCMDDLHEWIAARMSRAGGLNRDETYRRVGDAMMDASERLAFVRLTRKTKIELTRVTDLTRFSGWYETVEDARASWPVSKQPSTVENITVTPRQVLAVKWLKARYDVLLVPGWARQAERSFL